MNYQFDELEQLVSVISPFNFSRQRNKALFIKKYSVLIHNESILANSLLTHEFINCENELQARNYLQHHQRSIVRLLDQAWGFKDKILKELVGEKQIQSYTRLIQNVESDLEYILNSLQYNGNDYFQNDATTPQAWRSKYIITIKQLRIRLAELLKDEKIDIELYNIISEPLISFVLNRSVVSFYDFNYLNAFVSNLNLLLDTTVINDDIICNFLLSNNFNQFSFFNYYIKKISTGNQHESISLTQLYLYLKKINQIQKKTSLAFNKVQSSILEQVGTWLSEEIYFLEKKQLYNFHTSSTFSGKTSVENKVHTKLSVSHLSLGVKLLLDTGVIQNRNLSELIKMVANSFRTEKSEQISEDSLRNKVYNIENSAVETMKDIIINLLNAVKKY